MNAQFPAPTWLLNNELPCLSLFNLEFNRLPDDDEMVALAYAPDSGAAVFGERKPRYPLSGE